MAGFYAQRYRKPVFQPRPTFGESFSAGFGEGLGQSLVQTPFNVLGAMGKYYVADKPIAEMKATSSMEREKLAQQKADAREAARNEATINAANIRAQAVRDAATTKAKVDRQGFIKSLIEKRIGEEAPLPATQWTVSDMESALKSAPPQALTTGFQVPGVQGPTYGKADGTGRDVISFTAGAPAEMEELGLSPEMGRIVEKPLTYQPNYGKAGKRPAWSETKYNLDQMAAAQEAGDVETYNYYAKRAGRAPAKVEEVPEKVFGVSIPGAPKRKQVTWGPSIYTPPKKEKAPPTGEATALDKRAEQRRQSGDAEGWAADSNKATEIRTGTPGTLKPEDMPVPKKPARKGKKIF